MRLLFVDPVPWDYTPDTPYARPLGGSQSALCYLAERLAALGHEVGLLNNAQTCGVVRGVHCFNLDEPTRESVEFAAGTDAVIAVNDVDPRTVRALRSANGHARYYAWIGHACDQPAVALLRDAATRDAWDGLILASDWQARTFCEELGVEAGRVKVLGYGIAPPFVGMFDGASITESKPWPPTLAYTSTPFRGLDRLIAAFPTIRGAIPGTRLKVFSSMEVYGVAAGEDEYGDLYARCRATDGVEYVGAVDQPSLAGALGGTTCLAYPNTFAETACIAVMEAMAAGCVVVTSDLGALPETTAGFARLVEAPERPAEHVRLFADAVLRELLERRAAPEAEAEARLRAQVDHMNGVNTWQARAGEWARWLAGEGAP